MGAGVWLPAEPGGRRSAAASVASRAVRGVAGWLAKKRAKDEEPTLQQLPASDGLNPQPLVLLPVAPAPIWLPTKPLDEDVNVIGETLDVFISIIELLLIFGSSVSSI